MALLQSYQTHASLEGDIHVRTGALRRPFRSMAFLRWVAVVAMLSLAGCSSLSGWFGGDNEAKVKSTGKNGAATTVLWRSGDYFIRIEPQDQTAGRPPPNQHPIEINRDRLRGALGLVRFRASSRDNWQPLFTKENLQILGAILEEGLAKARPNQDVTFALESWHRVLLGIRSDDVITGRIFYANNRLNLIFGKIGPSNKQSDSQAELSARNKDIRLNPYVPGLRGIEVKNDIQLSAPPGSGVFRPAGLKRHDWLVFDQKTLALQGRTRTAPRGGAPSSGGIGSSALDDLRQEIENLKKRLGEEEDDGINRRLSVLQRLRDKGLISQEEFESRREKILSGL